MLSIIWRGYMASKHGRLYLLTILANAIIGGLHSLFMELDILTDTITLATYIIAALIVYATARYAYYLECNVLIIIALAVLLFLPLGVWLNLFYLTYKTFNYTGGIKNGTSEENRAEEVENYN